MAMTFMLILLGLRQAPGCSTLTYNVIDHGWYCVTFITWPISGNRHANSSIAPPLRGEAA
jgi:hypothetical protein